jgi:hypothetical protein
MPIAAAPVQAPPPIPAVAPTTAKPAPKKKLGAWGWAGIIFAALVILALIGHTSGRDQEAYVASYQAGLWASKEANRYFPFSGLSGDKAFNKSYLDTRHAMYEERKRAGREIVARSFGLTMERLDAIQEKGDRENWKVWDIPRLFDPSTIGPPHYAEQLRELERLRRTQ